jgi:uncharacterized protein with HEPN domain
MSRDFRLYLDDIIECCDRVSEYTEGYTYNQFTEDPKTVDAVIRNLEIIGEAVKNVPAEVIEKAAEIEWKQIARFRDNLIHRYFGVRLPIVWSVVESEIGILRTAALRLLVEESESEAGSEIDE